MKEQERESSVSIVFGLHAERFLDAFTKLQKATISFVISFFDVFPTVHHIIGYFLEPTLMHISI